MNVHPVGGDNDAGHQPQRLQTAVLRSVSRSFYLSIKFLPARLREPIALAYLLARTTDTVADTTGPSNVVRLETLQMLSNGIQGAASRGLVVNLIASFVELQTNKNERELLKSLPDCLTWLERMEQSDRDDIRVMLSKITRGQTLDLQRFDCPHEIRALATAADLDEYTYLVAGCVGEFWTRLCCRHVQHFANRRQDEMIALGKRYGMGLQLINVLRDAGADLRSGRCYFPESQLAAADLTASEILSQPQRFQPIYRAWLDKAKSGVEAGMEYSRAIRNRRVRGATVLPALIGARTLALLKGVGMAALQHTVKVPRPEVHRMLLWLAVTFASSNAIDQIFERTEL